MQLIVAEMLVEEGDNSSPAAMADDKRSKRMKRSKVNKSCVFDMPTSNEFSQEKVCHCSQMGSEVSNHVCLLFRVFCWSIKSLILGTWTVPFGNVIWSWPTWKKHPIIAFMATKLSSILFVKDPRDTFRYFSVESYYLSIRLVSTYKIADDERKPQSLAVIHP